MPFLKVILQSNSLDCLYALGSRSQAPRFSVVAVHTSFCAGIILYGSKYKYKILSGKISDEVNRCIMIFV